MAADRRAQRRNTAWRARLRPVRRMPQGDARRQRRSADLLTKLQTKRALAEPRGANVDQSTETFPRHECRDADPSRQGGGRDATDVSALGSQQGRDPEKPPCQAGKALQDHRIGIAWSAPAEKRSVL